MLISGNLPPVSNRETWNEQIELRDDDTGELFDLSGLKQIHIAVAPLNDGCSSVLSGTLAGGEIYIPSTGIIEWLFTESQMRTLDPGEYNVGITLTFSNETKQALVATVPVIDGIVD
jgi:hypothetical protein